MKKETKQIVIFLIPLISFLSVVYWVNHFVDFAGQNSKEIIYNIATEQQPTQTLIWEKPFDQRLWVKGMLDKKHNCPELLILGSSTLGALSQEMFEEKILNAWLTGPSIQDYQALSWIVENNECRPDKIVIGLDPWFFNKNEKSERWKSIMEEYFSYHHQTSQFGKIWQMISRGWAVFKNNLSYVTTRESVNYLLHKESLQRDQPKLAEGSISTLCVPDTLYEIVPNGVQDVYLRAHDGHFETCSQFVPSREEIANISSTYLLRNMHSMAAWHEVDVDVVKEIEILVRNWKQMGVQIAFVFPPYNPITYQVLKEDVSFKKNMNEVFRKIEKIASTQQVGFINLQDPSLVNCLPDEFNDSHHGNDMCMKKIAHAIGIYFKSDQN